ncbi:MAG: hypothetical protein IKD04_08880 [Clostridia bacterium]|nr:hypothetical protein [Clostridia bacterium]
MKTLLKRLAIIVLCLALACVGAGCGAKDTGSDGKPVSGSDGETETKVSQEFLDSLKGMSIKIAYPDKWRVVGADPIADEWAMNVNEVAKELGITITEEYLTNKANGATFVTECLAGNYAGNILGVLGGAVFTGVQSKAWAPLDDAIKEAGINLNSKYYAKYMNKYNNVDNGQYGITFNGANMQEFLALYYNVNMITVDNKLEDPLDLYNKGEWNFDKFEEYCKKLTKTDASGQISIYGCQLMANASMPHFIMANGGSIGKLDESGKWYQSLAESKTINALNYLYKWLYQDRCIYVPTGAWGTSFINLYEGTAAMTLGTYYCATNAYMKLTDEGGLGIVPLPLGPDGDKSDLFKNNGGSAYVIPAAYKDDAAKYVYVLDRIAAKWYDRYEAVNARQLAAVFYEDKYYDLYSKLASGEMITGFNEDYCCLVKDGSGYSATMLGINMQNGVSPATAVATFSTAMQNEQNDLQGDNRWTGFN